LEAPNTGHWELFVPVESTNCWVRVLGPSDHFSRYTNTVVITVFTPRKLLHQQNIETMDFPTMNYLHFTDGNRIVTYKSENDEFVYNVLENSLDKKRAK
jgi:hypothetical protein